MKSSGKRVLVFGERGRLGSELVARGCLPSHADVTNDVSVQFAIETNAPDVVIYAAGVTDVDGCQGELFHAAFNVNYYGVWRVRRFFDGPLIYVSTDYVFDGKRGPYREQSKPRPLGVYGYTKYAGERVVLDSDKPGVVVRTTRLYGAPNGRCHVQQYYLPRLARGEEVYASPVLYGNPTYIPHFVDGLWDLLAIDDPPRIVNIVGKDWLSREEFATMCANVFGYPASLVVPDESDIPYWRPRKAGLKTHRASRLGVRLYSAIEGLQCLKERLARR